MISLHAQIDCIKVILGSPSLGSDKLFLQYSSLKSQKCFKPDCVVRCIAISKKNTTHQNMLCREN